MKDINENGKPQPQQAPKPAEKKDTGYSATERKFVEDLRKQSAGSKSPMIHD